MRQTPTGQEVCTFGIATNREWITRDNRREKSAEFHECVAWARLAQICGEYLNKGKLVYIEGYLKTRSWDTPEGIKNFKTEVVVQDMIMLEKRGFSDNGDYIPSEAHSSGEEESMPARKHQSLPKASNSAIREASPLRKPAEFSKEAVSVDDDLGL